MTTEVDTELVDKWLEALRSGQYKQGKGRLRDDQNKYCCLGVLCDIVNPAQWSPSSDGYKYVSPYGGYISYPPAEILALAGIEKYSEGMTWRTILADMNDKQGKSFEQIADWIEQHARV